MAQLELPDTRVDLPPPIDAGPSPLLPEHLVDLFFRPRRFFGGQLALGKTPYALLVAWCYGAAAAIDRLDQNLLRADLGRPRPGWDQLAPYVVDSWPGFWLFVLATGAMSGFFLWWFGGWWFALRVRWSGAENPDRRLARLVMAYSAFIHAAPTLVAAGVANVAYASYGEAFHADEAWSLVLLIFPFWSMAASYTGVRTVFGVSGWLPRLWFVVLPAVFYILAFGLIATLFAVLGDPPAS
jgi:hypothetical protein